MSRKFFPILFLFSLFSLISIVNAQDARSQQMPSSIAIAPLSGVAGSPIEIIGNGFPSNSMVIIGIGPPNSEYEVVQTVRSDADGLVRTEVLVPNYVETSQQDDLVVVIDTQDNAIKAVSLPFDILASDLPASPEVFLSELSGMPGTEVTVDGNGYPANVDVILGVAPQDGAFRYSLRTTTNSLGSFSQVITIPEDARVNRNWIVLAEVEDNRDYQAFSQAFEVIGMEPAPPMPEGVQFTQADIFMIALEAGNNDVNSVGCGDRAIPVEVNFDPTVAPLTAALNHMFSIESRVYGQSGLYNALYQADLAVEGIDIDDGVATIALRGSFVISGACDTPRAIAQIEQTALQFATIDEVHITINGEIYL